MVQTLTVRFIHSVIHRNGKGEWNIVHVDDELWPDLFSGSCFCGMHGKRTDFFANLLAVAVKQ